jgi:hypothetical protein
MDLVSTTSEAVEAGHVFVFRFAGAGAEVTTSVRIEVPDPVLAEAFAANLLAEMSQRMEDKRMSYDALRALSAGPAEDRIEPMPASPAAVALV